MNIADFPNEKRALGLIFKLLCLETPNANNFGLQPDS